MSCILLCKNWWKVVRRNCRLSRKCTTSSLPSFQELLKRLVAKLIEKWHRDTTGLYHQTMSLANLKKRKQLRINIFEVRGFVYRDGIVVSVGGEGSKPSNVVMVKFESCACLLMSAIGAMDLQAMFGSPIRDQHPKGWNEPYTVKSLI